MAKSGTISQPGASIPIVAQDESGEQKTGDLASIVKDLKSDSILQVFVSPDFSAEQHVGDAVRNGRLSPALSTASRAADLLTSKMNEEIIKRQDALLTGVESLDTLRTEITSVSDGVKDVSQAMQRLDTSLGEPYRSMQSSIRKLKHVHATAEILRALSRVLQALQSLREAKLYPTFSSSVETPHERLELAAKSIMDFEKHFHKVSNLKLVSSTLTPVKRAKAELKKRASAVLRSSLSSHNKTAVTSAIRTLLVLGALSHTIGVEVNRISEFVTSEVGKLFDASPDQSSQKGRFSSTTYKKSTTHNATSSRIWPKVESMHAVVRDGGLEIMLLEEIFAGEERIEDSTACQDLYLKWLEAVKRAFERHSDTLLRRSKEVKSSAASVLDALIDIFPSLRMKMLSLMNERLPCCSQVILQALKGLEGNYLTTSFTRITDAVDVAVGQQKQSNDVGDRRGGSTVPDDDTLSRVQHFIDTCQDELQRARNDPEMYRHQQNNVAKGMRLFLSNSSDLCMAKKCASNARPNESWASAEVYQGLVQLSQAAQDWITSGSSSGGNEIAREVSQALTIIADLVAKLLNEVTSRVVDLINSMQTKGPDIVVKKTKEFIRVFHDNVYSDLLPSAPLGRGIHTLAQRVLSAFLHNSLVLDFRDIEKRERFDEILREIEDVVAILCDPRSCGHHYKAIRIFRVMLKVPPRHFKETLGRLKAGLPDHFIVLYLIGTTGFTMSAEGRMEFIENAGKGKEEALKTKVEQHYTNAQKESSNNNIWPLIDVIKSGAT